MTAATRQCAHRNTWFDRSICPEPCGSMHDVCSDCGTVVGPCPWADEAPQRRARLRDRMAQALAQHHGTTAIEGVNGYHAMADVVLDVLDVIDQPEVPT